MEQDPLKQACLDEVGLKLLQAYATDMFSSRKQDMWEVCIQM